MGYAWAGSLIKQAFRGKLKSGNVAPQDRQVEIYRQGQPEQILDSPSSLSGEDVLPGFVLDLSPIFE